MRRLLITNLSHMRRSDCNLPLNMYKFCHCLTKPIITRIIVSLVLENVVVRAAVSAVLFSEIL